MLKGFDFVYFGPEPWGGLWRNRHQLLTLLAAHNRVLYIEPQRHLRPTLAEWRHGRLGLAAWRWQPLSHIKNGLYVYHHPPFAPVSGLAVLRLITRFLRRRLLQSAARRLHICKPIVWISRPTLTDLCDVFDARLTIYHVVDEYSAYVNDDPAKQARTRERERDVLGTADMVIVVSASLQAAKSRYNPHTYLLPNGVPYAAYEQRLTGDAPVPAHLAAVPRPRLGYIGLIGDKLDLDLLESVARARPAWSLVFVGALAWEQGAQAWERLVALPNVHYLGQVAAQQVPDYVCGFDVGLMPYRQNRHVQFIDPLKLYDYLAAGKPIVSVPMPALDSFQNQVYAAGTPAEFEVAIDLALREDSPGRILERQRQAAAHSWERRVERLSDFIQARLEQMDSRAFGNSRPTPGDESPG
jgi:glycosyltransferase involved in cell wall biosynthesis